MGNSAVKEHIETAKKTGVFKLSQERLSEFPVLLYNIKSYLRTLDLSNNKLSVLPSDIGCFVNLKHIILNKNKISLLPDSIGNLQKLESLSVNDNELRGLPGSFSQLKHLKEVSNSKHYLSIYVTVYSCVTPQCQIKCFCLICYYRLLTVKLCYNKCMNRVC